MNGGGKLARGKRRWFERTVWVYVCRASLVLIVVLVWQGITQTGEINPQKFGRPSDIFLSFIQILTSGGLWGHLMVTLYEQFVGFAIGMSCGTAIGWGLWWSPRLARVLDPFAVALNGIPKIALAPPMIVWFGIFETSKIMLAAMITFIIAWLTAYEGTRLADRDQVDLVRVMGASRWSTFTKVVVPSSLPWVITSLKLNIGFALGAAIVGEFVTSNHGLGYLAVQATMQFQISRLWMLVFVIMLVAAAQYWIVLLIERRLLDWMN